MALDFLKRDVAKLEINLDRQTYQPGDMIKGRVDLQADKEFKIRGGKIAILCEEKYQTLERHRGEKGRTYTSTAWHSETREVFSKGLLEEMVLPSLFHQTLEFDYQLPSDAYPSVNEEIVEITWYVKATIDRPSALDINAKSNFGVILPMPEGTTNPPEGIQVRGTEEGQQDVNLSLWLPRSDWKLGEIIDGRLELQSLRDFKLSEIRVEITQHEDVWEAEGNTNEHKMVGTLAENPIMKAGQSLSLPFRFKSPLDGGPSFTSAHCNNTWSIEGILARRLAQDYHIAQDLQVFSKTPEAVPLAPTG